MLQTLTDNLNLIVSVSAASGALVGFGVWIRGRWVRPFHATLARRLAQLDAVVASVRPNGGASLYDKIDSIDRRLAVAEVRSKTVLSTMCLGEWHSNSEGVCVYVSPAACRLVGRSSEDFLGNNWHNVVWPEDRERVADEWAAAVRGQRVFEMRYRWWTHTGELVPIYATANPLFASDGTLTGWLAVVDRDTEAGKIIRS